MSLEFPTVETYKRRAEIVGSLDLHLAATYPYRWLDLVYSTPQGRTQVKPEVSKWCAKNMTAPYTFGKFSTEAVTREHLHMWFYSERDMLWFKTRWF